MTPEDVPPGSTCLVEVVVNPVAVGEVNAVVTLHTDSKMSEVIPLRLQVETVRDVPFMLSAEGELFFNGQYKVGDGRKLYVTTVEANNNGNEIPIVSVNLPFCSVSEPAVTRNEIPASERFGSAKSPYYQCQYTYELILTGLPPDDSGFSGQVRIVDPWDQNHLVKQIVQGDPCPLFRAEPKKLTFRFDKQTLQFLPIDCSISSNRDLPPLVFKGLAGVEIGEKSCRLREKVFEFKPIDLDPSVRAKDHLSEVVVFDSETSNRLLAIPVAIGAEEK